MLCGLEGAWVRLIVCRASVTPLIPGDSNLEGPTGAFWPQYCNSNCLSSHNRPAASYSESECPEKVFISIQTWEALGKIGYSSSLSQLPYSESETLDFRKPVVLNIELFQNQNIQVNVESIRKSDNVKKDNGQNISSKMARKQILMFIFCAIHSTLSNLRWSIVDTNL